MLTYGYQEIVMSQAREIAYGILVFELPMVGSAGNRETDADGKLAIQEHVRQKSARPNNPKPHSCG